MKKMWVVAAVAASLLAGIAPANAQWDDDDTDFRYYGDNNRGWVTLARKGVNGRVDSDRIALPGAARYRKLRLCSLDAPFTVRDMQVVYANGSRQNFMAAGLVRAGMCTRKFDLDGKRRDIAEIYLTYARVRGGYKPRLIVQGKI